MKQDNVKSPSPFINLHYSFQLLFTILEKSEDDVIRANIVIALGDLSFRFPNQLEPWTPRIYARYSLFLSYLETVFNSMKTLGMVWRRVSQQWCLCILGCHKRLIGQSHTRADLC